MIGWVSKRTMSEAFSAEMTNISLDLLRSYDSEPEFDDAFDLVLLKYLPVH